MTSAMARKLMNRLHTGQAISSHGPPSSNIAFENISCHDCNPSMMMKTPQWGQHLSIPDIQLFSFLQTNNCNLEFLQNATCLFAPEQTTTIYHKNESGADWRWTERWNGERWTKWLLKTLNWTQRIILKHQLRRIGNVNFELGPQCHCWRRREHHQPPPPLRRRRPHPRPRRPHCQSSHLCCWPIHRRLGQIQPPNDIIVVILLNEIFLIQMLMIMMIAPHLFRGLDCLRHLTPQGCLDQDRPPSSGRARSASSPWEWSLISIVAWWEFGQNCHGNKKPLKKIFNLIIRIHHHSTCPPRRRSEAQQPSPCWAWQRAAASRATDDPRTSSTPETKSSSPPENPHNSVLFIKISSAAAERDLSTDSALVRPPLSNSCVCWVAWKFGILILNIDDSDDDDDDDNHNYDDDDDDGDGGDKNLFHDLFPEASVEHICQSWGSASSRAFDDPDH